jgi:hypothetical protein
MVPGRGAFLPYIRLGYVFFFCVFYVLVTPFRGYTTYCRSLQKSFDYALIEGASTEQGQVGSCERYARALLPYRG